MFDKCKTTTAQGNVGLGSAIAWFTANNYAVSIPLNDSQHYDLIVEFEGVLKTVQVKTTNYYTKAGSYKVELRAGSTKGRRKNFSTTKVDYLFVLTANGNRYLIPSEQVATDRSINVGKAKYLAWLLP